MEAVGALHHPNIVQASDAGVAEGRHYLVMELVDGIDLTRLVNRHGPLPVADACELIRQSALGLDHASSKGLVHRDIKPSNLMLARDGCVKVLDLGLARLISPEPSGEKLTHPGQFMGTAAYMAPEQASDPHSVDTRADLYSLGCTFYFLLSGHAPFDGGCSPSPLRTLMAHSRDKAPPIREQRPQVPEKLAAILDRLLAKNRATDTRRRPHWRPRWSPSVRAAGFRRCLDPPGARKPQPRHRPDPFGPRTGSRP